MTDVMSIANVVDDERKNDIENLTDSVVLISEVVEEDKSASEAAESSLVQNKEEVAPAETNGESCEEKMDATEAKSEDPNAWQPHDDVKPTVTDSAVAKEDSEAGKGNEKVAEEKHFYHRRVVRLPKEVFDFMAKIEENGIVRFNLTQFGSFYMNELKFLATRVDAMKWDTEEVPILDVSIPDLAKEDPTLIVDHFSNDVEVRENEEKRLKTVLENREKAQQARASGAQILPADPADRKIAKKMRKRERREGQKKMLEIKRAAGGTSNGDETNKKRSAEKSVSSTALEGGSAAKQPRLDVNAGRTFPRRNERGRGSNVSNRQSAGIRLGAGNVNFKRQMNEKRSFVGKYQRGANFPSRGGLGGRGSFRQTPRTFQESGRDFSPLFHGRSPTNVSPWARTPFQDESYKLEQVMRRAALENASSFEATRQVERLGLGSAVGAVLNTISDRGMAMDTFMDYPPRQMPPQLDRSFNREESFGGPSRYTGGREPPRDISRFAEPIDQLGSSPRKDYYSHADRITYPTVSGGSQRGNSSAPQFGQSYSAFFAEEPYGQQMDYEGGLRSHHSANSYGARNFRR